MSRTLKCMGAAATLLVAAYFSGVAYTETEFGVALASEKDRPTKPEHVREMLRLAEVGSEDVVWDLGSGDGRIVIAAVKDFGARRAVGVEIQPELVAKSREAAEAAGVSDRVEFIEGDLFAADFSEATVVTLYLGHEANLRLRPKLIRTLKPGTRVVSNMFGMGEWRPDKRLTIRRDPLGMVGYISGDFNHNSFVPDYDMETHTTNQVISLWSIPAPIAGIWWGTYQRNGQRHEMIAYVLQTLNGIYESRSGIPELGASKSSMNLYGTEMEFFRILDANAIMGFHGRVERDQAKGMLTINRKTDENSTENSGEGRSSSDPLRTIERTEWRIEREAANIVGDWELFCNDEEKPYIVTIAEKDGVYSATCRHETHGGPWPVEDFYSFSYGFYFTLKFATHEAAWKPSVNGDTWLLGSGAAGISQRHASATILRNGSLFDSFDLNIFNRNGPTAPKE